MATEMKPRNPLVLTLAMDDATQNFLTGLRSKYFPPSRNHLGAHITLFHAIPPQRIDELDAKLTEICSKKKGWDLYARDPIKMGNMKGVMINIKQSPSGTTEALHQELLDALRNSTRAREDELTRQDMQTLKRPHVTVLNKARSEDEVEACYQGTVQVFQGLDSHSTGKDGTRGGQMSGRAVGFEL